MNHLSLVIKREYLNKVKNKSFIIMTFLSPLLMVGIFSLVAYLSQLNNDKVRTISVLDESGLFANQFEDDKNLKFQVLKGISKEEAKTKAAKEEVYGLLFIPKSENIDDLSKKIIFYSEDSPSLMVMDNIEDVIQNKANSLKLKEAGMDAALIKSLKVNIEPQLETFGGEETSKLGSGLKLIFGGAAGYLLFMFIIIYGNMIMRSVIEEKTSRIIEVIISSVKPIKLLLGKIIGTSLAGITQFIAWIILIFILSLVVTTIFGIDPSAIQSPQQEMIAQVQNNPVGMEGIIVDLVREINNMPITNLPI
ncbi:MAG: ABC transporter permease [Flavobacteriaceae bacterium]